jgi:hypothetical protein
VLSLQECKTADFLPRKGELLLRVLATDATYTDLLVVAGNYPNPAVKRLPVCPGYDCAAEVAAVGEGVAAGFSVGDVVISMPLCGCCAEFVRVDARHAVRVAAAAGAAFVRARPEVAASLALTRDALRAASFRLLIHSRAIDGGSGRSTAEVSLQSAAALPWRLQQQRLERGERRDAGELRPDRLGREARAVLHQGAGETAQHQQGVHGRAADLSPVHVIEHQAASTVTPRAVSCATAASASPPVKATTN